MKKTLLALALSSSLLFSSSISEKNSKYQPYQTTVTFGKNSFAKDSSMKDNTIFGIRATAYDSDVFRYGLQVGYESALHTKYESRSSTSLIAETDIHRFFVNMIVDGEEEYNVVPYLLFGAGYEFLSDELSNMDVSQGFAQTGLGFRYNITRSLNVALEGRGLGKFDTRDIDFIFSGAIGYMFGNQRPSPKVIGFKNEIKNSPTPSPKPILISAPLTVPVVAEIDNRPVYEENQDIDLSMTVAPIVETKPKSIVVQDVDLVEESGKIVVFDDFETTQNLEEIVFEEDIAKQVPSSSIPSYSNSGQFYVQMGAYKSRHSANLVSKLRNHGYNNTLIHTTASKGRDLNLILVGPYLSKSEVKKVQRKLKRINPQAFIYKMD